jgi:hypothetical protein
MHRRDQVRSYELYKDATYALRHPSTLVVAEHSLELLEKSARDCNVSNSTSVRTHLCASYDKDCPYPLLGEEFNNLFWAGDVGSSQTGIKAHGCGMHKTKKSPVAVLFDRKIFWAHGYGGSISPEEPQICGRTHGAFEHFFFSAFEHFFL